MSADKKSSQQYASTPQADLSVDLSMFPGVVIHQRAQAGEALAQAFGLPFEAKNKYIVSPMPDGVTVVGSRDDPKLWKPSFEDIRALPELFVMKEESDCLTRVFFTLCGCRAMRPMEVKVLEGGAETSTLIDKPCRCGGWICHPLEMTVTGDAGGKGTPVGFVKENFDPYCSKCYECCLRCSYYHNVYPNASPSAPGAISMDRGGGNAGEPKYELKLNICCCGDNNNCCGATCFNHNAIFEIRDPSKGSAVVGNVQKMFAPSVGGGGDACCRMLYGFDTFAVGFPEGSTHEERMMIVAGVLQAEFQLFETDQN